MHTCISEALEYPPWTIGIEKCCRKSGSVPSFPGNTKSNKDHNSFKLFWIGEPDKMIRCGVRNYKHTKLLSRFTTSLYDCVS